MSAVRPRRRPWGALWSLAPWDGKPVAAPPVVVPTTPAALAPSSAAGRADLPPARRLLRVAFGQMLTAAPWDGRPDPMTVTPTSRLTETPPPVAVAATTH